MIAQGYIGVRTPTVQVICHLVQFIPSQPIARECVRVRREKNGKVRVAGHLVVGLFEALKGWSRAI